MADKGQQEWRAEGSNARNGEHDVTGSCTPTSLGAGSEIKGEPQIDEKDLEARLESQEVTDSKENGTKSRYAINSADVTVVEFKRSDPDNPYNWKIGRKLFVLGAAVASVFNSTLASSLCAGASAELKAYFHIHDQALLVLPTSIFLVGYILGPTFFGPLSETYGRKWVMIAAFSMFTVFTMACALAPTFPAFVGFRLLSGTAASCAITVVGGTCADLWAGPRERGRAISLFMGATTFGPVFGPIISGFIAPHGWRWVFWAGLIIIGVSWIPLALAPESYGPTILKKRAKRMRKETGRENIKAPIELEPKDIRHTVTVVLTRPIRMICTEAIVFLSCLYLSLIYGIFYLFFQAFPIIFEASQCTPLSLIHVVREGIYGFNAGEMGLAFIPIGIGACIAIPIYLYWDRILTNARARDEPWCRKEEMSRLPLSCVGGPILVVSIFWIGWTAREDIHWIVPMLAGVPFGISFLLIFMGLINYLIDAYEIFAASANGAASAARSIFGAALPFAARPMYARLGVAWACSLLGFLSLLMCPVPFFFIRYGDRIRANSKFCQYLRQRKAEKEEEAGEAEPRREKSQEDDDQRTAARCAV